MNEDKIIILADSKFDIRLKDGAVTSLKYTQDNYDTDYIWQGKSFGDIFITYRESGSGWIKVNTAELDKDGNSTYCSHKALMEYGVHFQPDKDLLQHISINITYKLQGNALYYTIGIFNNYGHEIEIGDISIPFPMNSSFQWGKKPTESVLRHSFVSGNDSYIFWGRCNGQGPYLLMTPVGQAKLEYYDMYNEKGKENERDCYRAYIHSAAQGEIAYQKGCRWRQPNTYAVLKPKGSEGDSLCYTFKFQWASDYDDVRNIIVDEGMIDIQVIPGMTVPSDLYALFYLRTKEDILSVSAEFPEETELQYIGKKGEDLSIYKVRFHKLGENSITVRYGDRKHMLMEFFSTEPLETLVNKRAAFIAKCRHTDPDKWYNGLISEWNMETQTLLSPDNYDRIKGWRIYEVTCDDPGLCKPAYLAAKNAEYPVQGEVECIDYYIENFLWGGLQRTDEEEYPYGIYGIPDWNFLRSSEDGDVDGRSHVWRIYDYPHIVLLYWSMYKVAKNYPVIKTYLAKEVYLERAYRTALSMYTIPLEVIDWSAYKTGLYNELVIEDIIDEMYSIGWAEKALRLERQWIRKVDYFIKQNPDMFGSEYPFDSTGFESTHAFAKYGLKHGEKSVALKSDGYKPSPIAYDEALKFMEKQMSCNIFCRGWLEPAYYLLGSDYRGGGNAQYTLSYMSQMGGWAVLDYALQYSSKPAEFLRLGYASILSSWALMNSGNLKSGYGYWYPGEANDGGAAGGFEPSPYGHTWLGMEHHRGAWYYACEIDLGYCGFLRAASTILTDDPIFGLFCYGGGFVHEDGYFKIIMKDGVRRRFHALFHEHKFHILIDRDHMAHNVPLVIQDDASEICFEIESIESTGHIVGLTISGLPEGEYWLYEDGSRKSSFKSKEENKLSLNVKSGNLKVRICRKLPQ